MATVTATAPSARSVAPATLEKITVARVLSGISTDPSNRKVSLALAKAALQTLNHKEAQSAILDAVVKHTLTPSEAANLLPMDEKVVRVVGVQFANPATFLAAAIPLSISGDISTTLNPKTFSTGSYGWSYSGKLVVTLPDGRSVRTQASINLVVIGSKPDKE